MKPVISPPLLPYPAAVDLKSLNQFDQDLRRALVEILTAYAFRLNAMLPKDGSESMSGQLNIFNDTDISNITQLTAPLNIGTYAGNNMMIDGNEVQTRTNGVASLFSLNLFGGNITFGDTSTIFTLNGGKLKFPATQQASSDANTLDDYEENTWTPVLTFATLGDLTVVYTAQSGVYQKIGKWVQASFIVQTSTFTHTTAAGELRITGLPFTSATTNIQYTGSLEHGAGITYPAGRSMLQSNIGSNVSYVRLIGSGSNVSRTAIQAADTISGTGTFLIISTIRYEAAN